MRDFLMHALETTRCQHLGYRLRMQYFREINKIGTWKYAIRKKNNLRCIDFSGATFVQGG